MSKRVGKITTFGWSTWKGNNRLKSVVTRVSNRTKTAPKRKRVMKRYPKKFTREHNFI
jgi:hypothetical protein